MKRALAIVGCLLLSSLPAFGESLEKEKSIGDLVDLGLEARDFSLVQRNYENPLFPNRIEGFNILLLRMKARVKPSNHIQGEGHLLQNAVLRSNKDLANFGAFTLTGSGSSYVLHDLKVEELDEDALGLEFFPDRLWLSYQIGQMTFTLGRQAVTMARTFFWNPIDWVAPFTQNTIDRSYKPGVDVARVDYWLSSMSNITLLYALGEDAAWDRSGLVAKYSTAVKSVDLDLLAGKLMDDVRFGFGVSATPAWLKGGALRSEDSVYLPTDDLDKAFFRGTIGYDHQLTAKLQLMAEYYYNGFGTLEEGRYANRLQDARFLSGEITNTGVHYLAVGARYELTPLLSTDTNMVVNLWDGSLVVSPNLLYSLADEVDLNLGGFIGVGERPNGTVLDSEFGAYPMFFWLQLTFAV